MEINPNFILLEHDFMHIWDSCGSTKIVPF
jgi:hypothetical protein